ncbi:MAG TPA: alpha/beta hydrolase [Puia sp.]|jgi:pimeloyl-ACP methyl ester carboxylesterase
MYHNFLPFRSSRIHYASAGTGKHILFCFHGYGETAQSFAFLQESLYADFTIVAIDLPFHGQTDWKEGLFLDPRDFLKLLEEITARLPGRNGQWTFLGYSMGGRVALHLLQLVPEKIDRLVLLAPDGLQMNPWYWFATQTRPGNRLFRFTMEHPGWVFFLLRAGNALRWVNPGIYKFAIRYIDNLSVRQLLYTRWTTMRGFRPEPELIRNIIRSRKIPVRLLYGRYDRIIRAERGQRFRKGIEDLCSLLLLPTGHHLLHTGNLEIIEKAITS